MLLRVPTCAVSNINFTRDRQKPKLRARSLCISIAKYLFILFQFASYFVASLSRDFENNSTSTPLR